MTREELVLNRLATLLTWSQGRYRKPRLRATTRSSQSLSSASGVSPRFALGTPVRASSVPTP